MTDHKDDNKIVITTGDDVREMVREGITALGDEFTEKVKKAKNILVHPNLVTHFRKTATAQVEAVRGVVDHISLVTKNKIIIGDTGFHNTKKAFKKFDYESLKRSGNIELIDLNDDDTEDFYAYDTDFTKKSIPISKIVATSDFQAVVVPAKMHSYTIVSLSVKTQTIGSQVVPKTPFGIYARWPWNHTGHKQIHMTIADTYEKYRAQMAVIDGTRAMEGNGPASGSKVNLGWVITSLNPVVADALAVYLMGLNPYDIGYLHFLSEKGFGPIDIKEMDIAGGDPEKLKRDLEKPSSYQGILDCK